MEQQPTVLKRFIVSDTLKVHHFRTFKSTPLDA